MTRVKDLVPAALADLPSPCRTCVFWELAEARPPTGSGAAAKEAWWQAVELEWGSPGVAAYTDDRLVGFAVFGPVEHLPGARRMAGTVSRDAVLLATLWVDPAHRSRGLATHLVRLAARRAAQNGARALEAFGHRMPLLEYVRQTHDPVGCVLPEAFLRSQGFAPLRHDSRHPLFRLDLRSTARWQPLEAAIEGVRSALRRPEGVGAEVRVLTSHHSPTGSHAHH